jgi:hypothetical protein
MTRIEKNKFKVERINFIEKMINQGYTKEEISKMEGIKKRDICAVIEA